MAKFEANSHKLCETEYPRSWSFRTMLSFPPIPPGNQRFVDTVNRLIPPMSRFDLVLALRDLESDSPAARCERACAAAGFGPQGGVRRLQSESGCTQKTKQSKKPQGKRNLILKSQERPKQHRGCSRCVLEPASTRRNWPHSAAAFQAGVQRAGSVHSGRARSARWAGRALHQTAISPSS